MSTTTNTAILTVSHRQRRVRTLAAAIQADPFLGPFTEQVQGWIGKAGPLMALSGIRVPRSLDEVDSGDVDRGLLHLTHCLLSAGYVDYLREVVAATEALTDAVTPEPTP